MLVVISKQTAIESFNRHQKGNLFLQYSKHNLGKK